LATSVAVLVPGFNVSMLCGTNGSLPVLREMKQAGSSTEIETENASARRIVFMPHFVPEDRAFGHTRAAIPGAVNAR
jgi:hypothetical protein